MGGLEGDVRSVTDVRWRRWHPTVPHSDAAVSVVSLTSGARRLSQIRGRPQTLIRLLFEEVGMSTMSLTSAVQYALSVAGASENPDYMSNDMSLADVTISPTKKSLASDMEIICR